MQEPLIDHSQIRILIVDDEPFIRDSLVGFLEDSDFTVFSTDSAEKALNLISTTDYDVAIIDLRLPKMSGEALILKAHKIQPSLQFLIHTGSVDYSISEELKQIGLDTGHILHKPLKDMSMLIDTLERLAKKRG